MLSVVSAAADEVDGVVIVGKKSRAITTFNKTKYRQFAAFLGTVLGDDTVRQTILRELCVIASFDPEAKTYDKEHVARRRAETGKTTYELFQKRYYEAHKEEIDRKIVAKTRERRAAARLVSATAS